MTEKTTYEKAKKKKVTIDIPSLNLNLNLETVKNLEEKDKKAPPPG